MPKRAGTKGYRLKKWRRIKRDLSIDKRRFSLTDHSGARVETKHKNDGEGEGEV